MSSFLSGARDFFLGSPAKRENVSRLRPEQEGLYQQLQNAGMGEGAGGAFGQSADYYRGLLGNNSADFNAFAAPQMRQFQQDIMPGIAEQYAGMGAGGLSSSGFQNAATQAGTDLAERLGAIRANLRQAGAQGLSNIGQMGLGSFSQNMETQPGSEGFLSQIAPAIGTGIGMLGGMQGMNWLSNKFGNNQVGANTSPYGQGSPKASPSIQLPNFMGR